jgi:hypothetical protein
VLAIRPGEIVAMTVAASSGLTQDLHPDSFEIPGDADFMDPELAERLI